MTPFRRAFLLVPVGFFLVLLLAAVFRGPLLEQLIVLVLRQTLGLHATIDRVGGSVLTGLDLEGVTVRGEAGSGPLAAFETGNIRARYAPAALLRGREAFLDSLDVTLEGARLDLDLTGQTDAGAKPGDRQAGASSLPRLPRLTVRDSRVRIRGQGFTLEADGLQGTVARADQAHEQAVDIRVDRFLLRHPALREGVVSLAIAGRYAPRQLTIEETLVNGEPLVERALLEFGERRGELDLQLVLKLWEGVIDIDLRQRTTGAEVHWDARGVDLQPQLLLANPALGALRGQLSTTGEVQLGSGGTSTPVGRLSLDWKGALLAGRAVDHLVLEGSAEPGSVLVALAEGRIGSNEVTVHELELPASPLFEGRWRTLLAAASGTFTASLGNVPAFLALWGVDAGRGSAVPEHRLLLEGSLEQGRVRLSRGELSTGLGKATLAPLSVSFPREDQGWGKTAFSGGVTVDIPNLKDVSALFPVPPLRGSLRGEISGTGTFARPEGRASLAGRGISVAGRTFGDGELQARGTMGRILVDALQFRLGGSRFTARDVHFSLAALGTSDLGAFFEGLTGSFQLRSSDLPGLAALAGIPFEVAARVPAAHLLTVAGTVRGRAIEVAAGSLAAMGGTLSLSAARLELPGPGEDWKKSTAFEGDLKLDFPDLAPIATIFALPRLQGTLDGRARISGSAGAPHGYLEAAGRGIVIGGHRVGDVALKATVQRQRLSIETLEVARSEDRLRGKGAYDLEHGTLLDAEADLSVSDVEPYLAEFGLGGTAVSGRLHVGLRAAGPLPGSSPLLVEAEFSEGRFGSVSGVQVHAEARIGIQGGLRSPRVRVDSRATGSSSGMEGRPVQASLEATYEPGRLRFGRFELSGPRGLAVAGEGAVPVDFAAAEVLSPGPVSIRAQANIPDLEDLAFLVPAAHALTGSLRADIVVAGSWKKPEVRLEISGERLQLPPGTRFAPPDPFHLEGTLTWGTAEAHAEKVRLASSALSFSLSGTWSSPPALPALFADPGGATTGSLSLRTSFSSSDIGWLRESVPGLRRLHGSVAGEIAVDGPVDEPVLSGEIRIAQAELRYKDLPPIDTLVARATVARRQVTLAEFGGNIGGSPFTVAGSLDFAHPDDPVLDLRLRGTNVLLYRDEGLRVRADSDLTLRGPVSALVLAGEVALTDSLYQKDFTVASLFSGEGKAKKRSRPGLAGIYFPEPPLRDMRFDVRLTAREPFQVRTTVVRGAARPDLRLTGTGLLPILRGPILVDTARVILPSGNFEVERGTLLISDSDPDHPSLDFGGRMQALGYEITAQVGGTLDNPEVILSSIPPLPREELLLFVVTGAPPGSGSAAGGSVTAMASPLAVYLGKNVIGQLLGGTPKSGKPALQDRIELQIGRETTRGGSVTVDARLLLRKNPLGPGSALYLTSEKDIYDQYNAGLKILFRFE